MSVEYMREFMTLVEHMSFTAAAKKLNMTQSALSKHIAALEREFDASFFHRNAQAISLTQQGRAFCEESSRILAAYDEAQRRIRTIEPPVHIGGSVHDSAIMALISAAWRTLAQSHDGVELNIVPTPFQMLDRGLIDNTIDLYITVELEDDPKDARVRHTPFNRVPLMAVMEKDHPLASRTTLGLEDLEGHGIMCPTGTAESSRGSQAIERIFAQRGIAIRKHIFFANDAMDFPYAALGDNLFVMPQSLFNRQVFGARMDDFVAVALNDSDAVFPYRLAWRTDERRPAVLDFVRTLQDESSLRDAGTTAQAKAS